MLVNMLAKMRTLLFTCFSALELDARHEDFVFSQLGDRQVNYSTATMISTTKQFWSFIHLFKLKYYIHIEKRKPCILPIQIWIFN